MAAVQKLKEDFLSCSICTEVFVDPATLQCEHTFCRKCLGDYLLTAKDAVKGKVIPCPFCRQESQVSDPGRPVSEWVKDIKPSFLIQGLMDTFGSNKQAEDFCVLCVSQGQTTPASTLCATCNLRLCEVCLRLHQKHDLQHHNVTDLSEEVAPKRQISCPIHSDETIKLFCKDCNKAICTVCCSIHHRKCETVVAMETMVADMKQSLQNNKDRLSRKVGSSQVKTSSYKSQIDKTRESATSTKSDIRSSCQQVVDWVRTREKQMLEEVDQFAEKQVAQLTAAMKAEELATQTYKQYMDYLDEGLNAESEMDVYSMFETSRSGAMDVEDTGTEVEERSTVAKIRLSKDMDKLRATIDELRVDVSLFLETVIGLSTTPVHQDTVDVKTKEDKNKPNPVDVMTLMVKGVKTVVVTDRNNNCVKTFFTKNNQRSHNRLNLDNFPSRLAHLKNNEMFVSVPEANQIVKFAVNPELALLAKLKTSKQYTGLVGLSSTTIAAGSKAASCVDILDIGGKVLRSISCFASNQNMIQSPFYLSKTPKGNILVSDPRSKSVICVTSSGSAVFTYTPTGERTLRSPCGITATSAGDVLVVDYSASKLIQLDETGSFVKDVLTSEDGLEEPLALSIDGSGLLYVAVWNKGKPCVKVFKFE